MKAPLHDFSSFFRGLSDPTRLRILNLLTEGEVCVCHIVAALGMVQPKVSRHLAYLKKIGVVSARKDGRWIHYALRHPARPAARAVLDALRSWMISDRQMAGERRKAKTARCG